MVYPKPCPEGCYAAQDKGLRLVYPFSVCVTRYQHLTLPGVMDKRFVMAAPRTLPAPHDPAINCVSVHRFRQLFLMVCLKWMQAVGVL